jgi:hypothetical protein
MRQTPSCPNALILVKMGLRETTDLQCRSLNSLAMNSLVIGSQARHHPQRVQDIGRPTLVFHACVGLRRDDDRSLQRAHLLGSLFVLGFGPARRSPAMRIACKTWMAGTYAKPRFAL